MRTGALVRRHRVATVVLGVLAGLAAAVPMATWAAGRRTSDALDQFASVSDPPDVLIDFCPAGVEPDSPDGLAACNAYVPSSEMELIRSMDGVRHVGRASWTLMLVAASVDGPPQPATMIQIDEAPVATWSGDPVVVAGRLPDLDAPDELVVSDGSAAALGIGAGSEIWISDVREEGEPFRSTVVGVVRTIGELVPERSDSPLASGNPMFHASGAWSRAHGDDVLRASNSVGVFLDDRESEQFIDELVDRLPGRVFNASPPVDSELLDTARQATGYESRAAAGVALAAALAGAFMVAQAVARQSRRESDDRAVLHALGATRRDLVVSSSLRWAVTAALAGVVSVVTRRRGEHARDRSASPGAGRGRVASRSTRWCWPSACRPWSVSWSPPACSRRCAVPRAARLGIAVSVPGPPSVGAGALLALRGIRRGAGVPILSAVGAIAVAVAVLVAVASGATTIRDVTANPIRFGANFDAIVGMFDEGGESQETSWARVAAHPDVVAAAGIPGIDGDRRAR